MKFSFCCLLLSLILVLSSAAQINQKPGRQQFLSGRTNTVTTVVTSTASTASTTILTTRSICASLIAPVATTPCRRKRQYWNAPLFFALGQDDVQQFQHSLNPTEVLRVEPSFLPEFRYQPSSFDRPFPAHHQPFNSPFALQTSFDRVQPEVNFRVADPFFGVAKFSAFSSLYANILNNILTPVVTVTSTSTVFPSTTTISLFTNTVTLTLNGAACLPVGLTACPATSPAPPTSPTTTPTPTTTPATTPATSPTAPGPTTSAPTTPAPGK